MQDDFSRRVFLKTCSMSVALLALAEEVPGAAPAAAPSWVDRPCAGRSSPWSRMTPESSTPVLARLLPADA